MFTLYKNCWFVCFCCRGNAPPARFSYTARRVGQGGGRDGHCPVSVPQCLCFSHADRFEAGEKLLPSWAKKNWRPKPCKSWAFCTPNLSWPFLKTLAGNRFDGKCVGCSGFRIMFLHPNVSGKSSGLIEIDTETSSKLLAFVAWCHFLQFSSAWCLSLGPRIIKC